MQRILDGQRVDVSADARALVEVAKHILTIYPEAEEELLLNCSWLVHDDDDFSVSRGFLLSNGKRYYMNTNASWDEKRRRMAKMCEIANVKPGTVYWHKPGDNGFTFSW